MCDDENTECESEWESVVMYSCPWCGNMISDDFMDPIIRKHSIIYNCDMDFVECTECKMVSVYRMV